MAKQVCIQLPVSANTRSSPPFIVVVVACYQGSKACGSSCVIGSSRAFVEIASDKGSMDHILSVFCLLDPQRHPTCPSTPYHGIT